MTTYSYTCGECGAPFSIEATLQEKEEGNGEKFLCPKCQSKNIKPTFSVANFIKNIFQSDEKSGGCCSGGSCAIDKISSDTRECCAENKSQGGCCNSKK